MSVIDQRYLQKYGQLELLAREVVEGFITGLHKSPFHGFSVEFSEHRLYNKGESTKHLDWKLYARTGKLFIKRYEEETNLRCRFILDTSSSMLFPEDGESKLSFAIKSIAALSELFKRQRDVFGLSCFNDKVDIHTEVKSSWTHQRRIFAELEQILEQKEHNKSTRVVDALHEIAESIHKRSLVILFSDMFNDRDNEDELFAALRHLRHNKHELICFHVVDRSREIDLEFENRPYRFIDLESGEELKVQPNAIKKHYQEYMRAYSERLKLKCGQYSIDFIEADINKGFDQILLSYLIKRQKMI